jgi:iron(III) transport system substrate-binding protein
VCPGSCQHRPARQRRRRQGGAQSGIAHMLELRRRRVLGGLLAGAATAALGPALRAQGTAETVDLEQARGEGTVILYTSLDTKILDSIIASFTETYGIKVEYYRGGSADVTSKVLAEADAGRLQADIVDASDVAALMLMKERGILKPYRSPVTETVPAELRDPDDFWVADRLTQAIIQYNTQEVANPPATWQDLTAPEYQGRLAFFSSSNGDGAPRLYTLAQHFGWELLEQLAATEPMRVQTPQLVTQVLESGERAAGFLNNDNIAWRSKLEGKPTDFVYPAEGVPTELGAVGLIEGSSRPTAAMLFYDWWMGDEGQALLVEGGKYSSRTDLAPPKGSPPLSDLKLLLLDYGEYQANRTDILEQMADTFGGEWGV